MRTPLREISVEPRSHEEHRAVGRLLRVLRVISPKEKAAVLTTLKSWEGMFTHRENSRARKAGAK
jgi:hypothetical protein